MSASYFDGIHKGFSYGFTQVRGTVELSLIMDVENLNVFFRLPIPQLCHLPMEDDRSELHKHGSSRLEKSVQSGMRRADVEAASIDTYEVAPLLGGGLHIFRKAA